MQFTTALGRLSLPAIVLLGLLGCQSQPRPPVSFEPTHQPHQTLQPQMDVDALLEKAQQSISPQKEQLLLQAAAALYQQQELHWARNLLQSIPASVLNDQDFIDYTLLFSDIALADDSFFLAQRILTEARLEKLWPLVEPRDQITLRQRRADIFLILGEPDASVRERLALHPLLNQQGATQNMGQPALDLSNHNALWRTLMSMPLPELEKRSETSANLELRGWYQLALITKNNQSNLEKQQANIEYWRQQWAGHPASIQLPNDLQLLQQMIADRPQRIAILLPQQGSLSRAANAIRNGFMAAHYQAISQGNQVPIIDFYDAASGDIMETLQIAANNGAELAIGPLSKQSVASLHQLDSLPIPTLAVNYTDQDSTEPPLNLFQFGLSAEDEARQIAQRAWIEGHRNALILGTDANWGKRSAEAFQKTWEELGGTIVSTDYYARQKDYSGVIKDALNVSGSELRYRQLRDTLNQRMEFEPRRRQDVDMIFLIARHDDARQIKPTLDFHYASDLPVYASSHIYTGKSDRKRDRDLNGIRFTTLPWFFDDDSPEKGLIKEVAKPAPSYQRLYALGVDSYHLYPRLRQMEEIPGTKLYGVTGSLSLNQNHRIEREQIWARMSGGVAKLLPLPVSH